MIKYLLILMSLSSVIIAQNKKCGTTSMDHHRALSPQEIQLFNSANEYIKAQKTKNLLKTVSTPSGNEIHIPVVIHVIHTGNAIGGQYNPSDATLNNVITTLNNMFGNTFDDASITGQYNSVQIPVVFELAKRTPTCTSTSGINRINLAGNATYVSNGVGSGGIDDDILYDNYSWPTHQYYNVYVVNKIDGHDGTTAGVFTAGYANTFSGSNKIAYLLGYNSDGFIILASQATLNNTTVGHEVAHSLDIDHPFGNVSSVGGCPSSTGNCNIDNDGICDTDPVPYSFACNPSGNNPCTATPYSSSTTQYNYMAYFLCSDRFTNGQKTRMLTLIDEYKPGYKSAIGMESLPALQPVATSCNPTIVNVNNLNSMGPVYFKLGDLEAHGPSYSENFQITEDRTCQYLPTYYIGQSYDVEVFTLQNRQYVKVYIDYNNNGIFETTEQVFGSITPTGSGDYIHTGSITIPPTVLNNTPLRMRVIADFKAFASNTTNPLTPCYNMQYGQAEDYTIMIQAAPLSFDLAQFSLTGVEQGVQLDWTYNQSQPIYDFIVQRSANSIDWNDIMRVDASSSVKDYSALDQAPLPGKSYYRIKAVGPSGYLDYSKSLSILNTMENDITIFPNPANDAWQIRMNTAQPECIHITIYDLSGQMISESKSTIGIQHQLEINTSQIPEGYYTAVIHTSTGNIYKKLSVKH